MKNIVFIFIILFIGAIAFTSCKKNTVGSTSTKLDTTIINDTTKIFDTVPGPTTITGFYTGKIGNNGDYPSFQIAFIFRSNGTVRAYDNILSSPGATDTSTIAVAEGTYTVSGDTVTTYCKYLSDTTNAFSTLAIINSDSTYMEGSWGNQTFNTGGGYFFVYKQY
jgi:hypothetical protein